MATTIIGVNLENRLEKAIEFQKIITEYGCEIRTRIGLHKSFELVCSERGIVLLEVCGSCEKLENELKKYWQIQTMIFD